MQLERTVSSQDHGSVQLLTECINKQENSCFFQMNTVKVWVINSDAKFYCGSAHTIIYN